MALDQNCVINYEKNVLNWFCMDITKSGSCALIIKIPIWLLDSPYFLKGAPKKLRYFLNALYYKNTEANSLSALRF